MNIADRAGAIDASVVKRMLSQHGVSYAGGHSFLMNVPMLVDIMSALQRQSIADTSAPSVAHFDWKWIYDQASYAVEQGWNNFEDQEKLKKFTQQLKNLGIDFKEKD